MKIMVLLKRTPDTETKITITPNAENIDTSEIQYIMNPYDEFAIEEALKTKEKFPDSEVVICSYGEESCREMVLKALAMGGDRGVVICEDDIKQDPLQVSKILSAAVKKEAPDVVFCGKQGIDADNMQVGIMVATILGWPHVNVVEKLEITATSGAERGIAKAERGIAKAERGIEGGQVEVFTSDLPLVIGTDKSINTPRYVSLPGIMKAKRKPLDKLSVSDLGVDPGEAKTEVTSYQYPPTKPKGVLLKDMPSDEMVEKVVKLLREEAKVI